MIPPDVQNQIDNITKSIVIGEVDPFVPPTNSVPPLKPRAEVTSAPAGINVVNANIQAMLAEADAALKREEASKPVVKPAVVGGQVVKAITAQVIGDDRIFEIGKSCRIAPYEVDRIHKYFDHIETDEEIRIVFIPENAKWKRPGTTGYGSVLMCAHDATKKYLANMLGVGLDTADAQWYREHPLTETQGLPEAHTLTVLSDLVRPYGIGISHIYVKKSCSAYDEHHAWQAALGINPEALVDRNKSNKEFLNELGLEGEALAFMQNQAKNWNFEYVDQIPSPCIAMSGAGNVAVGSAGGGGHTTYYGPREGVRNFKMGLRFDRLENIKYLTEIPTLEGATATEAPLLELDFYACLSNNGKTMTMCDSTYTRPGSQNTGSGYAYQGNYGGNGPNGWSNPNTAEQFKGPEPSNVLRIGEQKKRNQNLPPNSRRKTRNGAGPAKVNHYNRFNPQEKARFAEFSQEFAGCSPDRLNTHELQANTEIANQSCKLILDVYYSHKVEDMFQMSGADNWKDMASDSKLGAKFSAARTQAIQDIDPLIHLLTLVDMYLMEKACKSGPLKAFMLSILNYIIYEEPAIADSDHELDVVETEMAEYFATQGVDPATGDFMITRFGGPDTMYDPGNTQLREKLQHLLDGPGTDPVMVFDEAQQAYVENRANQPPNHNSRLQAMLMEQFEASQQARTVPMPVGISVENWGFIE